MCSELVGFKVVSFLASFTQMIFSRLSLGGFSFFCPKMFQHYKENLDLLFARYLWLRRPFTKSIFPAASFNLGPDTTAFDHTDPGNVAHGECMLSSFGNFDHSKGGHLIL